VNYHAGNEHFRALVRKHKLEYVKCPKPQKGKFSRLIVDEIKSRNPPGRFLKQDPQTKLWYDIGDKKALDKTRQALREGAPDIMKEMSGESGGESDGDDSPRMVQKNAGNRRNSAPTNFTPDAMHSFMGSPGLQSPNMSRNGLLSSSGLNSPGGMLSPGLLLSSLSPDMGQFSVSGRSVGGRMVDPSALPGPPLQTQFDTLNQMNPQQQQQAQAMMMNNQMNNFGNMGNMMSPEQIQLQNQINAQQAQMQMLQRQLQQQQQMNQQMNNNNNFNEMQMMNKLQAMQNMARMNNQNNQNMPTPPQSNMMFQNTAPAQFEPHPIQDMPPPPPVQRKVEQNVTKESLQPGVESFPGNNARRMPPPSLMKREDSNGSIKMDKVFSSPQSSRKKYDANNSSTHLSAMSLSIGDMQDEGNLSSVFDSSLRISSATSGSGGNGGGNGNTATKEKLKDKSNKDSYLEMSVNTLGTNTTGNDMSYATLGDNDLQTSDGNMSFGKVFEDPKD